MITTTTFDPALLHVSGAKLTHSGGTGINLTYGADKKPLVFRTPFMLSFGINTWTGGCGGGGTPHHSTTLSFYGQPAEDPFFQVLAAMDQWLLQTASQRTWEWLKSKSLPLERLQEQHFRTLRVSSDGVPNIKFNLKTTTAGFSTLFFLANSKTHLTTTEDLTRHFVKGTLAAGLIQCAGIWVKDGRFGLSWKLMQMMLIPPSCACCRCCC